MNDVVPFSALMKRKDVGEVNVAVPLDEACMGLEVARDFGGSHGVCKGNVVSIDSNRRRPLYHILYADGDEEDCDYEELHYALQLLIAALKNGTPHFTLLNVTKTRYVPTAVLTIQTALFSLSSTPLAKKKVTRKRKAKLSGPNQGEAQANKRAKNGEKVVGRKKSKNETNLGGTTTFTVEGVMTALPDKTEYGISFRSMSEAE